MEIIDNVTKTLKDDLSENISKGSKLAIAASCFSIYAFQALKKELSGIEELRFIFSSPTFTTEKTKKEKREFFIPRLNRERGLYGTEFEVKLRNELSQKAIAKECASWIRKKVRFKSNKTENGIPCFVSLSKGKDNQDYTYYPIQGFTTVDLGCEKGNNVFTMINRLEAPFTQQYLQIFDNLWNNPEQLEDVTKVVLDNITQVYAENAPEFLYYVTLYNIFKDYLDNVSEDVLPNVATGFKDSVIWNKLYKFQKDAALGIINKLEEYNGCILADSVGLGKTFTALAVMKYYQCRNKSILVLCPKKLAQNWNTYKANYKNNPLVKDRLNYDVLFHTDLSRRSGLSNGLDLGLIDWGNYDLVVIDESHNFRNGGKNADDGTDNRYDRLMKDVMQAGVQTKVLMLSATPVNNKFIDLKYQLQLAYEGDDSRINEKLHTTKTIAQIFHNAQVAFNKWTKLDNEERTTQRLLSLLDFDFFELLDSVTIARSRKHIEKYYGTDEIGTFPTRLKPITIRPHLTDLDVKYDEIYDLLDTLRLSVYIPSSFILPSKRDKYVKYDTAGVISQANRELGIRRLMSIGLMKRMESSVYSFRLTVGKVKKLIDDSLKAIDNYINHKDSTLEDVPTIDTDDLDEDEQNMDKETFTIGRKVLINIADMDYLSWARELKEDQAVLNDILQRVDKVTPEHDEKLQTLKNLIMEKITHPINPGNKKILIFTAFADTAQYLYENLGEPLLKKYGLYSGMITGSNEDKSTMPRPFKNDFNNILTYFSPISKEKDKLAPNDKREIDILIATDCISEGQNLQDCDYLINYDIHWNPVRIVQRFGRIDRIGSHNAQIQLVNFWPDITLDAYINLKARVEERMVILNMAAGGVGSDNMIATKKEEINKDLEYRKDQLKRLQDEVVDIEDMNTGISIMDLGLNDFRQDIMEYRNHHPEVENVPFGLHAVVPNDGDSPTGVIYILKNLANSVNINNQNQLHPFYMVYIADNGNVVINHLQPKELLDRLRRLCKDKTKPIVDLCAAFNEETNDGRNMEHYSDLLGKAISSIIEVKDESDLDSFLSGKQTSFFDNVIRGLDDFELICFFVVKGGKLC